MKQPGPRIGIDSNRVGRRSSCSSCRHFDSTASSECACEVGVDEIPLRTRKDVLRSRGDSPGSEEE